MAIFRVTAEWSGFNGAPGYSVFHFSASEPTVPNAQAAAEAVQAFMLEARSLMPNVVSIRVSSTVDILDETNGVLQASLSITALPTLTGMVAGAYSAPSGAVVHWLTMDTRNGRRVRGRTFLVPLASASYDGQGTLVPTTLDRLNTAATALRTATPVLEIWGRPSAPGATDGGAYQVTGSSVPDMAAILRSRRD